MEFDLFGIQSAIYINIFGFNFLIFRGLIYIIIALIIMLILGIRIRFLIDNQDVSKNPHFLIIMYENLYKFSSTLVDKIKYGGMQSLLDSYAVSLFIFLFLINCLGLFGLEPPASNIFISIGLGILVAITIHIISIFKSPKDYLKSYIKPSWLFLPLNIVENFSQIISISMRLFGNMLAGCVLSSLLKYFLNIINQTVFIIFYPIIGGFLSIYSDIFIAGIQTLIFTSLNINYIKEKL